MQKHLGQEYPDEQRIQFLEDNCSKVEEVGYTRRFTPDEITEMKDDLSKTVITVSDIEEEKKRVLDEFKERLKQPKEILKELIGKIRNKSEFVKERCYAFLDDETRTVGYYNSEGELIETRPMRPEEMQTNMFHIKTGTNS